MIKILSTGLSSSIQDLGRFGLRHYGVPVSGCMDLISFQLANSLLNNSKKCSVIETTYLGPTIEFLTDTYIAITGAHCQLTLNSHTTSINKVIDIKRGDVLQIGKTLIGTRNYLAIVDGFDAETYSNSQSQLSNITKHSTLQINQVIKSNKSRRKIVNRTSIKFNKSYFKAFGVSVFKGPEFKLLPNTMQKLLLSNRFEISPQSNRMSFLLNHNYKIHAKEIITSAVQPGTIQLTPSGKLIILMRDCQTTGGYARVLQLTSKSISQLSQLPPKSKINFTYA